jgi:hypothetical protein
MMNHLLDRIVSNGKDTIDTLTEIAPFIIFAVIWLLAAISKAVQSQKVKKDKESPRKPAVKRRQPDLEDFVRMVKQRYAEAREAAKQSARQREYIEQTLSQPPSAVQPPRVAEPAPRPRMPAAGPPAGFKPPAFEAPLPMPEQEKPLVKEPSPLELGTLASPVKAVLEGEHPLGTVSAVAPETHPHLYLAELAKQLSDPNGLRRAILYSEILGTPVGLRD